MRPLSVTELLAAWERGLDVPPTERALTLLAACSTEAPDALARLSIGRRDARRTAAAQCVGADRRADGARRPASGHTTRHELRQLRASLAGSFRHRLILLDRTRCVGASALARRAHARTRLRLVGTRHPATD